MEYMYTNKYTVTINGNEAFIDFSWIVPEYDENDNVVNTKTIREQGISLSTDALRNLGDVISNLIVKTNN